MNYLNARKLLGVLFLTYAMQLHSADKERSAQVLQFLYQNPAGKVLRSALTQNKYFSAFTGWLANRSVSKYFIPTFIKQYQNRINMSEALEPNILSYKTFNEFFIRKLKPEARPIDNTPNSIISPADGRIYAVENLNEDTEFLVKGKPFDVKRLLGQNSSLSVDNYKNGTLMVVYLGPWNYHRFHFPLECKASQPHHINGSYESVNSIAYQFGIQPLIENERHLITLENEKIGKVAFLPIGALCVGKIVETYNSKKEIHNKGDEIGYFEFGGSTIVMLFPENTITLDEKLKNANKQPFEIKMGERIALINSQNIRP